MDKAQSLTHYFGGSLRPQLCLDTTFSLGQRINITCDSCPLLSFCKATMTLPSIRRCSQWTSHINDTWIPNMRRRRRPSRTFTHIAYFSSLKRSVMLGSVLRFLFSMPNLKCHQTVWLTSTLYALCPFQKEGNRRAEYTTRKHVQYTKLHLALDPCNPPNVASM